MAKRRIGVFGGTFDPPHLGHLLLAETIREQLDLDEVLFVPSHDPPHKERPDLSPATHRYAMVVAATLHNEAFTPSAIEVNRPGKSYSVDTVRALSDELGPEAELYFVAGLDSFLELETWKDYEELLDACHFVVVSRPKSSFEGLREGLPERFHERLIDAGSGEALARGEELGRRIYLTGSVYFDLSSTEIRERVREGNSVRYRVTPEVAHYIRTHDLYSEPVEAEDEEQVAQVEAVASADAGADEDADGASQ